MIEWTPNPRCKGVHYYTPEFEIDVWQVPFRGWQYTIYAPQTDCYYGYGSPYPDMDSACEAALASAKL